MPIYSFGEVSVQYFFRISGRLRPRPDWKVRGAGERQLHRGKPAKTLDNDLLSD
jgi:hypothetical protein